MDFELAVWREDLVPSLAESANDARIVRWLNDGFPVPYTINDAERFIRAAVQDAGSLNRAILSEGRVIGGIGVTFRRGAMRYAADIGYWLTPEEWGKGIMTQAVRRMCDLTFAVTDIIRIQAEVFAPNAASLRVLEKCGFVQEGTLRKGAYKRGEFFDSRIYGLVKE